MKRTMTGRMEAPTLTVQRSAQHGLTITFTVTRACATIQEDGSLWLKSANLQIFIQ